MAQAQRELQPGEHVSWNYGAGQAKGQVVEKLVENKKLGSRVFKASPDDPKYLVKSDTSGKEAIKKPETLHKIDEDAGKAEPGAKENRAQQKEKSSSEERKEAVREENSKKVPGAKEKRTQQKERSSSEERKEAEREENSKKVQDTGKGSVRASTKAAQKQIEVVAARGDLKEETGEQEDATYEPKKDELEVQDDEEALDNLPADEEVLAQAEKEAEEEGLEAVNEEGMEADEGEQEDRSYDPAKDDDVGADAAEDEEVIDTLPPDEELVKQTEKENKEVLNEAADKQQRSAKS
ncbi:hypothetical protein L7F22_004772 [Adiantum nelumboides]|nr:hypothetical protein [Adiantum nelumboides]